MSQSVRTSLFCKDYVELQNKKNISNSGPSGYLLLISAQIRLNQASFLTQQSQSSVWIETITSVFYTCRLYKKYTVYVFAKSLANIRLLLGHAYHIILEEVGLRLSFKILIEEICFFIYFFILEVLFYPFISQMEVN